MCLFDTEREREGGGERERERERERSRVYARVLIVEQVRGPVTVFTRCPQT